MFSVSDAPSPRGIKRVRRACLNCRRKKVRCYFEQPACSFCVRLGQTCIYPDFALQPTAQSVAVSKDYASSSAAPIAVPEVPDAESDFSAPRRPPGPLQSDDFAFVCHSQFNFESTSSLTGEQQFLSSRISFLEKQLGSWATVGGPTVDAGDTCGPGEPVNNHVSDPSLIPSSLPAASVSITPVLPEASTLLPPFSNQQAALDAYFFYCHDQPYSFFHEESFRYQFVNGILPDYVVFAILSNALRFSNDPFYGGRQMDMASSYAAESWKSILSECLDSEDGPNYRTVQAATLLAVHEFTSCKHSTAWVKIGIAVSIAQSLHMMVEPSSTLPMAIQEEHRRTLWSVYLLDKMATCGRIRPPMFQDHNLRLRLPCSRGAFTSPTVVRNSTLARFNEADDSDMTALDPFAQIVVIASTLSRIANYAFQQTSMAGQKPPWDHSSDYTILSSKLTWYATHFDSSQSLEDQILPSGTVQTNLDHHSAGSIVFGNVLFHLCYCLLQHPFLLRRQFEASNRRYPVKFFEDTTYSNWKHAQELTDVLTLAQSNGWSTTASFLGYCSLVAGMINSLHCHSSDKNISVESTLRTERNLTFLKGHAKYYKNCGTMAAALEDFINDSARYSLLVDASCREIRLTPDEIDHLYSLLDYGALSKTAQYSSHHRFSANSCTSRPDNISGAVDADSPYDLLCADTNAVFGVYQNLNLFGNSGDFDSGTSWAQP